jgi:hypothetical protein
MVGGDFPFEAKSLAAAGDHSLFLRRSYARWLRTTASKLATQRCALMRRTDRSARDRTPRPQSGAVARSANVGVTLGLNVQEY